MCTRTNINYSFVHNYESISNVQISEVNINLIFVKIIFNLVNKVYDTPYSGAVISSKLKILEQPCFLTEFPGPGILALELVRAENKMINKINIFKVKR